MSDGFARTGKTELAAKTLEKGLEKYPDNVDLWVGLGNALVAHGGGMMSPAAALAFDEAAKRDPAHPAPPFFAGLAMAQSGDLKGAEAVRSEEHTSELQSLMRLSYAVFCLKKKNKNYNAKQ